MAIDTHGCPICGSINNDLFDAHGLCYDCTDRLGEALNITTAEDDYAQRFSSLAELCIEISGGVRFSDAPDAELPTSLIADLEDLGYSWEPDQMQNIKSSILWAMRRERIIGMALTSMA